MTSGIVRIYEKIGKVPTTRQMWSRDHRCVCGSMARLLAKDVVAAKIGTAGDRWENANIELLICRTLGWSLSELLGYTRGFDGMERRSIGCGDKYLLGWRRGRRDRLALIKAGLLRDGA